MSVSDGHLHDLHVELSRGVSLGAVVDLRAFNGLSAGMGAGDAVGVLGPPTGLWTDTLWGTEAPYYDRSDGRYSFAPILGSGSHTGAATTFYPKLLRTADLIRDRRALAQVESLLPVGSDVAMTVSRKWLGPGEEHEHGRVEMWLNRNTCRAMVLLEREQ